MPEREIKLQIAPLQLGAVQGAMQRGRCVTTRARSGLDTSGHHLSAAGWVLRVRCEGRRLSADEPFDRHDDTSADERGHMRSADVDSSLSNSS